MEAYKLVIKSDSLANLETAIDKFTKADSLLPNGYKFTTAGQPGWIDTARETKDPKTFTSVFEILARWDVI